MHYHSHNGFWNIEGSMRCNRAVLSGNRFAVPQTRNRHHQMERGVVTTKLKFIEAAAITFNCTHSTVLAAVSGRFSVHAETSGQIKELANKSCNATTKE